MSRIKEETFEIQKNLDAVFNTTNKHEDISRLLNVWKETKPISMLPGQKRFLSVSKEENAQQVSTNFVDTTKYKISNMLKISDGILNH